MRDFFRRLFHPIKHRRFRQGQKIKSKWGLEYWRRYLIRIGGNWSGICGYEGREEYWKIETRSFGYDTFLNYIYSQNRGKASVEWFNEYMNKPLEPEPTTSQSERERKRTDE